MSQQSARCVWCGPVFEPTGYADEGRGFLHALEQLGVPVALRATAPRDASFRQSLTAAQRETLARQEERVVASPFTMVQHFLADGFVPASQAAYLVGRTMFETDSLPPHWVPKCNGMDELWVPSAFNAGTFRRAGVRVPIHVVPGGIDCDVFHPKATPLVVPGAHGTTFLAVFEWRTRKGWDVLLRAWAEAFRATDDVTLVLRVHAHTVRENGDPRDHTRSIAQRIDDFLLQSCGRSRRDVGNIVLLLNDLPPSQMPSLYTCAHALVAPTRGEGWGRPFMEAMACGVPAIATRWGAQLSFMNDDNALLLANDGLSRAHDPACDIYDGHQWATPSVSDLVAKLRGVHAHREAARAIGTRARQDMVANWSWHHAAQIIAARLSDIHVRVAASTTRVSMTPVSSSGATRLHIDADIFGASGAQLHRDELFAALETQVPLGVYPRATALCRPSLGMPVATLWPHVVHGSRDDDPAAPSDAHDETITLSWLSDSAAPGAAHGRWCVAIDERIAHAIPAHMARMLRDRADVVFVPHQRAFDACRAVGVTEHRLRMLPVGSIAAVVTPNAARFPRPRDVTALCLLPIRSARDIASAQLVARVWPRVIGARRDVRLQLLVPRGDVTVFDAAQQLFAQVSRAMSTTDAIDAVVDELSDDTLPSYMRTADVILALGDASPTLWNVALACGRPLVVAHSVEAERLLCDSGAWIVPSSAGGTVSGAALQTTLHDVMRTICDETAHTSRCSAARQRASSFPSWSSIAQELLADCMSVSPASRVDALVHDTPAPFSLIDARSIVVAAFPDWHAARSHDVITQFASTFAAQDDVTLAICHDSAQGVTVDNVQRVVHAALAAAGRTLQLAPDIMLVTEQVSDSLRAALIARADAVIAVDDPALAAAARSRGRVVVDTLSTESWMPVRQLVRALEPVA